MAKSETVEKHGIVAFAALLLIFSGCQDVSKPDEEVSDSETSLKPEVNSSPAPIEVNEGELWTYRPEIVNRDQLTGGLVFQVASEELAQGCLLDESTGELQWTPDETQGPGSYHFQFSCHPQGQPTAATQYALNLTVAEANAPPRVDAPHEAKVPAGSTLELPLGLADDDFPANRVSLELKSGPQGVVVDELGKLVYWEVPANWQQPQVEITVAARDDGVPPLTTTHQLAVTITDIRKPEPKQPKAPPSNERIPEVAVDLPSLPRPGEPIEPVALEFALDPPMAAEDVRLSLMLPDDLRGLLKMRYLDDHDTRLAIMLTSPFEADDIPGNLTDGIAATCTLTDSKYIWTWAMTKDLAARGYQNNIRHGVLTIESKQGGPPRLVALQKAVDVPAPTLDEMLADDKLQMRLLRHDRVKKSIALEGRECTADNGGWEVDLESQVEGFSLFLVNPELMQRVNARSGAHGMRFTEFGFRVLPISTEITIGLDAKPSPADSYEKMRGARKSLIRKQGDARRWQKKFSAAQAQLRSAQSMSAKSPTQRKAKSTKIAQASRAVNQAQTKLAKLAVEIPADENLVATMEKQWEAIVAQLQPVRDCVISGELSRRVGDVRVSVLRLVPVDWTADDATEQPRRGN